MLEVIDVGKCTDGRATPVPIVDIAGQEDSAGIGTSRDGTERDRTVRLGGHRVCAARPGHPGDRLGRAGLWVSDLRSLLSPSIALSSAGAYLKAPAEREDVASAADYYALVHKFASSAEATTGNEEAGRRAGIELGVDPAAAIDSLVEHALSDLAGAEDQRSRSRVASASGYRVTCPLARSSWQCIGLTSRERPVSRLRSGIGPANMR